MPQRMKAVERAAPVECRPLKIGTYYKLAVGPRSMVLVREELKRIVEEIEKVLDEVPDVR